MKTSNITIMHKLSNVLFHKSNVLTFDIILTSYIKSTMYDV